jgi:hypothetical protein
MEVKAKFRLRNEFTNADNIVFQQIKYQNALLSTLAKEE